MAGSSSVSTHTSFTGAGALGQNAGSVPNSQNMGSILSGTSAVESSVTKGVSQSKGSVDTSINAGHATAKAQFSQGQKAAMAIISRAFRRR